MNLNTNMSRAAKLNLMRKKEGEEIFLTYFLLFREHFLFLLSQTNIQQDGRL